MFPAIFLLLVSHGGQRRTTADSGEQRRTTAKLRRRNLSGFLYAARIIKIFAAPQNLIHGNTLLYGGYRIAVGYTVFTQILAEAIQREGGRELPRA